MIEAAALALWIGALAGFAFVFAPAAFRTIPDVAQFGGLVGSVLSSLNLLGYVCGAIALIAVFIRNREDASLGPGSALRALLIAVMLVLVVLEGRAVIPTTHQSAGATFDRLHLLSIVLYAVVLVLGFTALAMSVLARPESVHPRPYR